MSHPRLLIAGTASGVGKTTITLAVLAACARRGRRVQAFKVGPDFIDPGHHTAVTGRSSRNLDGWMLGEEACRATFLHAAADADLSIIEGMMGLFDSSTPVSDRGSSAEAAKWLGAPVVLVIDGSAMARSAAAMAQGFARFDPALRVAGVVFNRVAGERHYRLLKEAVETLSSMEVFGYLPANPELAMPDRHLGLVTATEQRRTDLYERLGRAASASIDLDRLESVAASAPDAGQTTGRIEQPQNQPATVAVAYDAAFNFYYADNLALLEAAGARIVRFSPLRDARLPDADLLYLGGGYPELYGAALAGNRSMRASIRAFADRGGAVFAECGGLMYLTEAIVDLEGKRHEMVGLFAADTMMDKRRLTMGYRELRTVTESLFGPAGVVLRGHEFHYSRLIPTGRLTYSCRLEGAQGEPCGQDGLVHGNTLALYTHIHFGSERSVASALLSRARSALRHGGHR